MGQPDLALLERSLLGETDALVPLNHSSIAYANACIVKSGTGFLYGFSVYNSSGSAQFIQVFDARTLPAEGAIPAAFYKVETVANLRVSWLPGRTFTAGIVLVNSSTGPTKTIGSADCWFDAQYL